MPIVGCRKKETAHFHVVCTFSLSPHLTPFFLLLLLLRISFLWVIHWDGGKSTTSIRGTINPKWWSFLGRFDKNGTAITSVIRCLNHTACHYIIIKHQQMWCDITGSISPCEKAINICDKSNIKGKQTELAGVWMSGTTVVVDWFRWYIHPFRLRGQTETQRKQRKYTFCAFVTLNKCLIAFQLTFLNFSVFAQSHLGCFSFVARPQEKEVTLLSCLYYRVKQLSLVPFTPGVNISSVGTATSGAV